LNSNLFRFQEEIPLIYESVVDFWESIPRDWPKCKYDVQLVDDLDKFFKEYCEKNNNVINRILDCGCGAGNPSIGLINKGYEIFCVDADPNMVERFRKNCIEAKVEIPVIAYDWRDLNGDVINNGPFDAAICRGNSLIYAGCWDRESFIPNAAAKAIQNSLNHISSVLKPEGLFYVDITGRKEYADTKPKLEIVGMRETDQHYVFIYWINEYYPEKRTRLVHARRIFESKITKRIEKVTEYTFTGYMLYHDELQQMANDAGLSLIKAYQEVPAEWLYDIFIFQKKK